MALEDGDIEEGGELETEAEGQEVSRPSVEEAIALAMAKHSEPAAESSVEAESEARKRGPDGKFVAAESEPAPEPNVAPEPTQPALPPINAPASWASPQARQTFSTLPRELQEEIARREHERDSGLNRKFEEAAQAVQFKTQLEPVFQRYQSVIQQSELPPAQLVEELLKAHAILLSNPKYGVAKLAQNLGVAPEDLGDPNNLQGVAFDPRIDAIHQELAALRAEKAEREAAQAEHSQRQIIDTVTAFAHETNAKGERLRPNFEKVHQLMKPIVAALREAKPNAEMRAILQEAYEQAEYAHPETRQALVLRQAEELAAKRQAEAAEKAAAARKAGASIKGSPGGPASSKAAPKSVEDAIRRAMEIHG